MHLTLPLSPLIVSTLHAILLSLLFHYNLPCGKGAYREAEPVGSVVLGSLLVRDVGSLLTQSDQLAFSTAHFQSLSRSSSSVTQKMHRNLFVSNFG